MTLADFVLTARPSAAEVAARFRRIEAEWFAGSRRVRAPNFGAIDTADLILLFDAYDREAFGGIMGPALGARTLRMRLSRRLTKAAGTTTRTRSASGEEFEIAIAIDLIFDAFREGDRDVAVCGVPCASRADVLLRVFEHELIHLTEYLCWGASDCAAARFQGITRRLFGHDSHRHDLITRRERAAAAGLQPGARVAFDFEGERLTGVVNRVNKRATVLVRDDAGRRYTDGHRYRKYYIPFDMLEPAG